MNVKDMLRQASDAAKQLITLSDQTIIGILKETAQVLRTHTEEVLAANRQDLERMDPANPKYDRLKLTEERLQGIAADMENVSTLPSPLNKVLNETTRPNKAGDLFYRARVSERNGYPKSNRAFRGDRRDL